MTRDAEILSHRIAYPLRHDTNFPGLDKLTGWACLYELYEYINKPYTWDYFVTLILQLVNPRDKRIKVRYQMNSNGDLIYWQIRALQGHTIKTITIDVHELEINRNILLVHGTKNRNMASIKENGLKKIRNDIHFIPVGAPTMRQHFIDRKSEAFIYTTTGILIDNGYQIFKAPNNVYLVPEDIPFELLWELGTSPFDL